MRAQYGCNTGEQDAEGAKDTQRTQKNTKKIGLCFCQLLCALGAQVAVVGVA